MMVTKKLSEVCNIKMGQSPDSSTYNQQEVGLPFFQGNADFGIIHPKAHIWCSNPIKIAELNDVLISVRAPIGAMNIADCRCCIGRGLAAITPNDAIIDHDFLYFYLISRNHELNELGTGSIFKSINGKTLSNLLITYPENLPEQRAIAAALKSKLDAIAAMEAKTRKQLAELEEWIEKLLQERLVDSATDEWETGILDDFADINPSIRELTSRPDDTLSVSFVPMPAVSDKTGSIVQRIIRPYGEVKKGYTFFQENDVIFAKITPCMQNGKSAVATGLENGIGFGSTEFHVLHSKGTLLPEWLHLFLRRQIFLQDAAEHMQGAVGQQRLPESYLKEAIIRFPKSNDEQHAIIDDVLSKISTVNLINQKLTQQLANLSSLRSALYREAFGGDGE